MPEYSIIFNETPCGQGLSYDYGKIKSINLVVSKQSARICYNMKTKYTASKLMAFSSPVVRDAYRKIHQLHAVLYDCGLQVKKITVVIDDEYTEFDSNHRNFPFLFSMLKNIPFNLSPAWKNIAPVIISKNKSDKEGDPEFSAVFSFLASKGRAYEIDRFSNLWTSMNAHYTFIVRSYEKYLSEKYVVQSDEIKKLSVSTEADTIGASIWQLDKKYHKFSKEEAISIWKDNYKIEKTLSDYGAEDIKQLYDALYTGLQTHSIEDKYEVFVKRAEDFGLSAFTFMLFEYPYHWRCKYVHGNRATSLFLSFNDYELAVLKTINYFLERYLDQEIPKMFSSGFWNQDRQEKMENYMRVIKKEKELKKYNELLEKYKARAVENPTQ